MHIMLLAVGRMREPSLRGAAGEYLARLRPYLTVTVREIAESRGNAAPGTAASSAAMVEEGSRILTSLPAGYRVFVLDPGGDMPTSEEFARILGEEEIRGVAGVAFVLGGPSGLDRAVLAKADRVLSLSRLTLPHQLARVVLLEQVYRAFRILRGEPYHR